MGNNQGDNINNDNTNDSLNSKKDKYLNLDDDDTKNKNDYFSSISNNNNNRIRRNSGVELGMTHIFFWLIGFISMIFVMYFYCGGIDNFILL